MLGRSGGTSDTMLWLAMSLLMVAERFPPVLLDMSKADVFKSNFLFSSGIWPVTGCRNVLRLSLWLWRKKKGGESCHQLWRAESRAKGWQATQGAVTLFPQQGY